MIILSKSSAGYILPFDLEGVFGAAASPLLLLLFGELGAEYMVIRAATIKTRYRTRKSKCKYRSHVVPTRNITRLRLQKPELQNIDIELLGKG